MKFLKRIGLFFLVNIAVITVIMTIVSLFGLDTQYLTPHGIDIQALAVFSLLWGMIGSFVSLLLSKQMAKWMLKIKIIKTPQNSAEIFLTQSIQKIASQRSLPMPEIGIYQSPEVNAFATGFSQSHSLVAVSSGLLQNMSQDEIEGVLAHEMAHIDNGDMITMTLLQGIMNAFVIFFSRIAAFAVERFLARDNQAIGGMSYWIISIVFQILFGILASVVVNAFSRHREFAADAGAARSVGKAKMIAALKKLQVLHKQVDTSQSALATMKISDKPSWFSWFSTHPPLKKRIEALQQLPIG